MHLLGLASTTRLITGSSRNRLIRIITHRRARMHNKRTRRHGKWRGRNFITINIHWSIHNTSGINGLQPPRSFIIPTLMGLLQPA